MGTAFEVTPFEITEAVDFVMRRSGQRDRSAAAELAAELGNLPLALEQACAFVDETGMQVQQYLTLFRRNHDRLLTRGAPSGHRTNVATSWRLLFERVRAQSPLAATVLEVSAFLSADGVPLRILERLGDRDELAFADAVAHLLRRSLMGRDDSQLRIHRLVQTVLRDDLDLAQRRGRVTEAVRAVRETAPGDPRSQDNQAEWAASAPQVSALLASVRPAEAPEELLTLGLDCYRYLRCHGALQPARQVLDQLFVMGGALNASAVAELRLERGDLLDAEGDVEGARAELEGALQSLAGRPLVDPRLVALTKVRLGHARNCGGEARSALALYEEGLAGLRREGAVLDLCHALIGFGYTHWSLRDYAGGERQFREALEVLSGAGWTQHPLLAEALSGLGMMLHEQGRPETACELQEQALTLLHGLYGDADRAQVAETRDKLGYALGLIGRWADAREQHRRATDMLQRLFGSRDPRYATALANLGLDEAALGRPDLAAAHQRQALDVLVEAYGDQHPTVRVIAARVEVLPI